MAFRAGNLAADLSSSTRGRGRRRKQKDSGVPEDAAAEIPTRGEGECPTRGALVHKRSRLSRSRGHPELLPLLTWLVLPVLWSSASAFGEARRQPVQFGPDGIPVERPLVIALGGARGPHPLYTLGAYRQALDDGVRTLECKVGITKDGVPVCCPGLNLEYTSDVKPKANWEMAGLYSVAVPLNDKEPKMDGWFIFNFTMDKLSKVHVMSDVRHQRTLAKGRRSEKWYFLPWARLPTVAEFLDLVLDWAEHSDKANPSAPSSKAVAALEKSRGEDFTPLNIRPQWDIRIILEPLYAQFIYDNMGLETDHLLLKLLSEYKLLPTKRPENETETPWERPRVAVHIQSKEAKLLKMIQSQAPLLPLIQVLDVDWDQANSAFPILPMTGSQAEWRQACWDEIPKYAWAVSVSKDLLLPRNNTNYLAVPQRTGDLPPGGHTMRDARSRNLTVLSWSFCEDSSWPMAYDFNADPYAEHDAFVAGVGVDGIFTACPATSKRYLESRICLELLAAGQQPITSEELGWTEFLVMVIMVVIAVMPMGAGLMYAIYKWRESEQFLAWQDFTTGASKSSNSELMMAAMGPTSKELESVPLTQEEWDQSGPPDKGKKPKADDEDDSANLLTGGEDGERMGGKPASSGTWRMRRGAEWNSEDVWS